LGRKRSSSQLGVSYRKLDVPGMSACKAQALLRRGDDRSRDLQGEVSTLLAGKFGGSSGNFFSQQARRVVMPLFAETSLEASMFAVLIDQIRQTEIFTSK